MGSVALVVLSLTPLTRNLDDIKKLEFLGLGSLLAIGGLLAVADGLAPSVPKYVGWGLTAYGVVLLVSTWLSKYSWAGWPFDFFYWAAIGFFLGGMAAGSTWQTARAYLLFAVLLLLGANLLGFFHYDVLGNGSTGTTWLYRTLYGDRSKTLEPTNFQALLYTFNVDARERLMSTILNRQFYADFCLLYFPMAVALALIAEGWAARGLGIVTTLMSLVSIFLCKSKAEYLFGAVSLVFLIALFAFAVRRVTIASSYLAAWVGGVFLLMVTFLFLHSPTLIAQMKTLTFSVSARKIIFAGAWKIFLAFPILGSGPGTFILYFPRYRSPDYFQHEISNVTELAHNYILDILSETGIAGIATFAFFAVPLAVLAFRMVFRAEDSRLKLMLIACLAGLLGIYGSNMSSTSARWPIGAVGLWSVMGFMAGLIRQGEQWKPAPKFGEGLKAIFGGWSLPSRSAPASGNEWKKKAQLACLGLTAAAGLIFCWRDGIGYWNSALLYNQALLGFGRVMDYHAAEVSDFNTPPEKRRQFAGTLKEAGNSFRRAIDIYPGNLSAYYKLGSVENTLANLEFDRLEEHLREAKKVYETLQTYAPDYAEIAYNLGVVDFRLALWTKSKLAELPPGDAEDSRRLNAELIVLQEQSRKYFELMRAMSNKAEVFYQLADTYFRAGDFKEAQETYKKALELYPTEEILSSVYFADKYYEASVQLKDQAGIVEGLRARWNLHPGDRSLLYQALQIASDQGMEESFNRLVDEALERNPVDPMVFEKIAARAEKKKDNAATLKAASQYLELMGNKEMAEAVKPMGGEKPEVILKGAQAADVLHDKTAARKFYDRLAASNSPFTQQAKDWLAANP